MNEVLCKLGKEILFFDGAMGTVLQGMGLRPGEAPELWNLAHPDAICGLHAAYLEAGAQIVKANTFGANPFKCRENGVSLEEVVKAGVGLARRAVTEAGKGAVALDIGPTGRLLAPLGDLPFEEAVEAFSQMVKAGAQEADCILVETMNDLYEAKAAVLAAKENSGRLGVTAVGLNCGLGPVQMAGLLKELRQYTPLPIIVNPNAGLPKERGRRTVFDVGPEEFSRTMGEIVENGAWIVGGCCGTTPEHIRQTVALCASLPCAPAPGRRRTVAASGMRAVEFGGAPVIIGERINPTGRPALSRPCGKTTSPIF